MADLNINSQSALEKLLLENLKESRRRRRWGIFFKLAFGIYFIVLLALFFGSNSRLSTAFDKPHTAVIDITGTIMPGSLNDADNIVASLTKAYKAPNTKGIILRINSPGGSPVQASYIFNNIMRLRKTYPNIKIYAVCSDVCASAAYYIAAATDDIYANPSSLVGSIGVLLNGFGFVDTMKKLGISRRLITAGANKGFLDPFSPITENQKLYAEKMLEQIHQQFIHAVEIGRGNRLHSKNPNIFSGLIWTGETAKKLGLIDGFSSAGDVARNIIKAPKIINYTPQRNILDEISKGVGASFAHGIGSVFLGHSLQ